MPDTTELIIKETGEVENAWARKPKAGKCALEVVYMYSIVEGLKVPPCSKH